MCAHTSHSRTYASFPSRESKYVRFNSRATIAGLIRGINRLALVRTYTHDRMKYQAAPRLRSLLSLFLSFLYYTEQRGEETSSLTFSSIRCFPIPGERTSFPAGRRSYLRHDDTGQQCGDTPFGNAGCSPDTDRHAARR